MTPLTYLIIGLAAGGLLAAIVLFLVRRNSSVSGASSEVQAELIRRLELLDRGLRDEFSRNREEGASAAKHRLRRTSVKSSVSRSKASAPLLIFA